MMILFGHVSNLEDVVSRKQFSVTTGNYKVDQLKTDVNKKETGIWGIILNFEF